MNHKEKIYNTISDILKLSENIFKFGNSLNYNLIKISLESKILLNDIGEIDPEYISHLNELKKINHKKSKNISFNSENAEIVSHIKKLIDNNDAIECLSNSTENLNRFVKAILKNIELAKEIVTQIDKQHKEYLKDTIIYLNTNSD